MLDTANAATMGVYKLDTFKRHRHNLGTDEYVGREGAIGSGLRIPSLQPDPDGFISDGSAETAPVHARVTPYVHV